MLKDLRIPNVAGWPDENSGERALIVAAFFFEAGWHESISAILLDNKFEIYKNASGMSVFAVATTKVVVSVNLKT